LDWIEQPSPAGLDQAYLLAADLAARAQLFGKNKHGQYLQALIKGG